ncbi:MAG: lytic transglycosylase domain-containing protein [Pseudomonadota bacterium]
MNIIKKCTKPSYLALCANWLPALTPLCLLLCLSFAAKAQEVTVQGVDPAFSELMARCAPTVHPETMAAVVSAESKGHQFAIADAGPVHLPWSVRKTMVRSFYPGTLDAAVAKSQELIKNGHTVSLGFAQVNDRNLRKLGVSLSEVFDPCTNIAAGGRILTGFYERAAAKFGPGTKALRAAISAYNSGDWLRGEKDGYVDLVYQQVGRPLAIRTKEVVPRLGNSKASKTAPRNEVAQINASSRTFTMKVSDFAISQ